MYSEAAIDNPSAGCSSSSDTALPNMSEMKYDKCIDISDSDEKCSALSIFDGLATMGDNKNNGRPDGLGQVDLVVANLEKCNDIGRKWPKAQQGVTGLKNLSGKPVRMSFRRRLG